MLPRRAAFQIVSVVEGVLNREEPKNPGVGVSHNREAVRNIRRHYDGVVRPNLEHFVVDPNLKSAFQHDDKLIGFVGMQRSACSHTDDAVRHAGTGGAIVRLYDVLLAVIGPPGHFVFAMRDDGHG